MSESVLRSAVRKLPNKLKDKCLRICKDDVSYNNMQSISGWLIKIARVMQERKCLHFGSANDKTPAHFNGGHSKKTRSADNTDSGSREEPQGPEKDNDHNNW